MSTLCLPLRTSVVRPSVVVRREIKSSLPTKQWSVKSSAKLQHVEDVLLNSILDHHPDQHSALSRLLADVDAAPDAELRRDPHSFSPTQMQHMEALLIAVAIGAHERRDSALNDLLHDI